MTLLEPRLVKKLLPPLVNLIQTTTAMSVMYECIQTILVGGMIPPENELDGQPDQVAQLCLSKLQVLIQDPDQNCKSAYRDVLKGTLFLIVSVTQ